MAYPYKAKDRVEGLVASLRTLHDRDPEQDVLDLAVPVVDAVLEAIKTDIGRENPVVMSVEGVLSPERIASGEPIRVVDFLIVAEALNTEIGKRPPPEPTVMSRPSWMRR